MLSAFSCMVDAARSNPAAAFARWRSTVSDAAVLQSLALVFALDVMSSILSFNCWVLSDVRSLRSRLMMGPPSCGCRFRPRQCTSAKFQVGCWRFDENPGLKDCAANGDPSAGNDSFGKV